MAGIDPKVAQALLQSLQQVMQIIQSAAGANDEGGDEEMDDGDDMEMDKMSSKKKMKKKSDFMQDDEEDMDDEDEMSDDDSDDTMDEDMDDEPDGDEYSDDGDEDDDEPQMKSSDSSLHNRLSKLERHTGLKKAASNTPIVKRIDRLENEVLGEEYEGSARDRVEQLESVTLGKAAKSSQKKRRDEAPDVIPLDALIKTAVATGIEKGLRQQNQRKKKKSSLTPIQEMRKNAGNGIRYGSRKGQPVANSSDEALTKTAQNWGVDGSDLDAPVGFGDALMTLYQANKSAGHGSFNLPEAED